MRSARDEAGGSVLPTLLGVAVAMLICATLLVVGLAVRPSGGFALPAGYDVVHVDEFTYGFRLVDTTLPSDNTLFVDRNRARLRTSSFCSVPTFSTRLIAADLAPGHDALVCNLAGHYGLGMHVDITVK